MIMKGNMLNWDVTVPKLIDHAEKYTYDAEIVSRELSLIHISEPTRRS